MTGLAMGYVRGLVAAIWAGRFPLLALGLGMVSIAPGRLPAQGKPGLQHSREREDPVERERYFYRQRANPFKRIPPHALQAARASYKARWPGAVRAQSVQAVSSATGWAPRGPSAIPYYGRSAGRVRAIAIDPTNSNVIYVGAAQGGVWKTVDGGASWVPLTDAECSLAMGALAVDPVTPSTVYAGTGEITGADGYYGCGVLRSTDGGATWTQLGGAFFDTPAGGARMSKIVIDPATAGSPTSSTVFAATSGGLYKSTTSGTTWTLLLTGGFTDLVADPTNGSTLYAAGSPRNDGVYEVDKSTDGGANWIAVSAGFPPVFPISSFGRIQIAISASSPATLYAAVTKDGTGSLLGLFKTEDAGATWTHVGAAGFDCGGQCFYDLVISVDPSDPQIVYLGGVRLFLSTDGGVSFSNIGDLIHGDQHAFAFDPANPSTIFAGNDGGIFRSSDRGQSWVSLNTNLAITQFYPGISVSPNTAPDILGGTQDNGTVEYTGDPVWSRVLFSDGGFTAINFQTPTTAWAETYWQVNTGFSGPRRRDSGGDFVLKVKGITLSDPALFIPPLAMDPVNPQVLYFGTFRLYRTTDNGESWSQISPDLSQISAIAVAASNPQTIYVGNWLGTVAVTADGGASWTSVNVGGGYSVTDIAADATDPQRAYVTLSGFTLNQGRHVFRTLDRGVSWQDISSNLVDIPVSAILRLPGSGELYIGTDLGIFHSTDDGTTWEPSTTGLPNVAVLDLVYQGATQTIVAATHGRGVFVHAVQGGVLRGDVSLDGGVSPVDAQGILAGAVGLPVPTGWVVSPNGDANCDGQVTALDAQIVLSYVVGLPTSQFCVGTVR